MSLSKMYINLIFYSRLVRGKYCCFIQINNYSQSRIFTFWKGSCAGRFI
jgi:hypothetical protein